MFKLFVIEPWEFGTVNGVGPFTVEIKKGAKGNWLLIFKITVEYKGIRTMYLLGKPGKKHTDVDLLGDTFERIELEMAPLPNLNEANFKDYDLDDYRGAFLTGSLSKND